MGDLLEILVSATGGEDPLELTADAELLLTHYEVAAIIRGQVGQQACRERAIAYSFSSLHGMTYQQGEFGHQILLQGRAKKGNQVFFTNIC